MSPYISIDKTQVPYHFEITLGAELFELEVRYNSEYDFFTVDLTKDGEVLVYGEKIVYGVPLFTDVEDQRYPIILLVPKDDAGLETRVGYGNLEKTVFLQVVE